MKTNKPNAIITNLELKCLSTSAKGIGMYAITFNIGQRKFAQTRHMTAIAAKGFVPSIEIVQSGGRTLGSCSFRSDGKQIIGQSYVKAA